MMLNPARLIGFVAIAAVAFGTATAIAAIGEADAINFTTYAPPEVVSACAVEFGDTAGETALLADGSDARRISVSCGAGSSAFADAQVHVQDAPVTKSASMAN